ncbi:hypothetical protein GPECTOR_24g179 [Gonium pectorale]|uniref:Uncharacterized protein n=1 Tax=Gonium pectorale TaxID=33097 RepID=A0A150GHR1_GONPE|nr:hypothetical protein GPECTOR_24g179 [Gonium pectorale]|eukprot:KXZ48890.1 hypothetical protein GPECTOR_24g179 [Gonium pectorale]
MAPALDEEDDADYDFDVDSVLAKHLRQVTLSAMLTLEDSKRFGVKVEYHEGLKAVFSLIPGNAYDSSQRSWLFPLSQYRHVMDAMSDGRLRTRGVQLNMQPSLPDFVTNILKEAASRCNDEHLYDKLTRRSHESEMTLDERMMPFQREGVRHALRLGGRVLIGDEMGLGKTVQACCLLRCYSEDWPALVVVPKSLRDAWADALFAWLKLTDSEVFVIHNVKDADQLGPSFKPKVVVVSYDSLMRCPAKLRAMKFRVVVLDEAHYIKNSKAQRTKEAMPLLQDAKRVVLLTGTPALSKPAELVPLLQALMPSAGIKPTNFCERYSIPDKRYPGKFYGARNEPELNKLLAGTVMVRRLKKDVLHDLPAKRRQQIFIRLPDAQTKQVQALSREVEGLRAVMKSMDAAGGGAGMQGIAHEKQQAIMHLWRETAKLKVAAVSEYCADLLAEGRDAPKFLVFAHHQVLLDGVEQQVKACKVKYIRIDGQTSSEERAAGVSRFQNDEDVKVAILSIKAAGVGLTMTASSLVVFAELSWVPGDITQAEDRCHRIGQSSSVNVHFLLVRGSVDEIMWDTVQNKLGNVGKVLDGSGASIKVDATRELRGYSHIGAQAARPGGPSSGGGEEAFSDSDRDFVTTAGGGAAAAAGVVAGPANNAPAAGPAGARKSPLGGHGGGCRSLTPTAGGSSRRISDFFAPVARHADGKAPAGATKPAPGKGLKRGREAGGVIEVPSDDERDFKKR